MTTAIVTGATGITGSAIVDALSNSPTYTKIHTLSRSQQCPTHPKISHSTLDLQSSAESMASQLSEANVSGSVIFFCAYLARDDEGEASKVNKAMLQNFLDALRINGVLAGVKRVLLVCGLKQYGVHLGAVKQPMMESDSPLVGDQWPPNFYYAQQEVLVSNAKKDGAEYDWTVTFPQDVIGFAKGNFMNEATALGLYAVVSGQVNQKRELPFPGSRVNYLGFNCWTSSELHARFCLWAVGEEKAANQCFNVVNGDAESWMNLWPRLAERFGCVVPGDMFGSGEEHGYRYGEFESAGPNKLHDPPPVSQQAGGFGVKGLAKEVSTVYQMVDTVKWSQREEVKKAWDELKGKYGLDQQAWDKATWGFLTFVLGREMNCVTSMSKARRMGWTGYQDTWESFEKVFDRLESEGILPPAENLREAKTAA